MQNKTRLLAVALVAASIPGFSSVAAAAPLSQPLALQDRAAATAPPVETVQFRRWGGWRGRGWGWWGPGLAAGAIVGGPIAASRPWGYGYYDPGYAYAPGYSYYDPGYAYRGGYYDRGYAAAPGGDDVAYCQQRFRSYDPASGTYLGYDGLRHPCP
jgi:BA14K-like protein